MYSMLLSSGEVAVYEAESRILECSSRYGPLTRRRNFEALLADYLASRQFARSGLEAQSFVREALVRCTSYVELLAFFMGSIAAAQGKRRWVEKTPNHVYYMDVLSHAFPDSLFIHVIRDGRDVAVSQRRLGWLDRYTRDPLLQLVWGGKIWEGMVRSGIRGGRDLGQRYLEVRYEDMVADVAAVARQLHAFTGLPLSMSKIEGSRVGALRRGNTAFGDTMRGVSNKAVGRWKQELTEDESRAVEWAVRKSLRRLGYRLEVVGGAGGASVGARLHALAAPLLLNSKRLLNRYTPVGRRARKPLEIGLE